MNSNEKFLEIFNRAQVGMARTRISDGKILEANDRLAEIYGYESREELMATQDPAKHWIDPAVRDRVMAENQADGGTHDREARHTRKDGSTIWVRMFTEYFPDLDYLETITIDITGQKLAQQALRESEQRFRDFAAAASDWFWELDADGRYTYVSAFPDDIGHADEWYMGRSHQEVVDAFYDHADWQPFFQAFEARKPIRNLEVRRMADDGSERWVRTSGIPVFAAGGEFSGYRGTSSDITDQLRAERALATNERLFRSVIDHAPVAIIFKDRDGRVELVNRTYEEFYNFSAEDILGKTLADIFPPEAAARHDANDRKVMESRNVVVDEVKVTPPGRSVDYISITKFPVFDQFGGVTGVGTITMDVSAQKTAEERLRQSQKMEAVGQLTGGIAHEFNNLLQVVVGNLELLRSRTPADDQLERNFQAISRNVARGAELTSRLLSFSRRQPLAPKALDIAKVLAEMQGMLAQTMGETITVNIKPSADIWMAEADPGQLENALLNLAINARDAMPGGGVITLSAHNIRLDEQAASAHEEVKPGDYVILSVSDTGSGMTEEDISHAFEPFFTTKDVGKGTGLGLSMVYGFAQQSGGFAEIESEIGVGTTMRLYLPRLTRTGGDDGTVRKLSPEVISQGRELILLVEDDADVRESLAAQLINLGYRVIEAADGAAALAALTDERRIDLLFTDVVMPGGMSGLELAREISLLRPGLKIIFTTGHSEDVVASAGNLDGNATVLRKPYDKATLAATIAQILNPMPEEIP